jgi:hypothetical protein
MLALSIIVAIEAIMILFMIARFRVTKTIFDDHRQHIEMLINKVNNIEKVMNLRDDDY